MKNATDRERIRTAYRQDGTTEGAIFIPAKEKVDIFNENQRLRVCAYCRVSTDNDEQLSSFELQQAHYRKLAEKHPNWDLLHIFADEGISGTSLKNRDDFNAMIERCIAGEFDLIVTKSVSRFARNLVDCVSLIRKLRNLPHPVGVLFETDGLNTLSEDSELKLSILATFAQEESVKKSESMNWSLRERFKSKKLLTPELFGYRRPRNSEGKLVKYSKLEIYKPEAAVVSFIYDAFLAGFTKRAIANILSNIGIETKTGSTKWLESSIHYILTNERYCGSVLTWKTFTYDIFEHRKKRNVADRDQYFYPDTHEAIIPVEKFESVQMLLADKKYMTRGGGLHIMRVIDMGVFQGYVPINHRWLNDSPDAYYEASDSVRRSTTTQKMRRSQFSAFDLTGYQVVRGQFLTSRSELPCMTISNEKITLNSFCTRNLPDTSHVQLLLHPVERKLAIRPCKPTDIFSLSWLSRTHNPLNTKSICCQPFCTALFQIMDWNPEYTYKIFGTTIEKGNDRIIIFTLSGAMPYVVVKDDEESRKHRVKICPEEWGDSFGEEFYDFSVENGLYYAPATTQLHAEAQGRIYTGQLPISLPSESDVLALAEQLRTQKTEDKNE